MDVRDVFLSYQDIVLIDSSTWPIDEKSKGSQSHYRSTSLAIGLLRPSWTSNTWKKLLKFNLEFSLRFFSYSLKSPLAPFGLIVSTGNFLIYTSSIFQELETVVSRGYMNFLIGKLFDNHRKSSARLNSIPIGLLHFRFGLALLNCRSYQYDKDSIEIVESSYSHKLRNNHVFKRSA